MFWTLVVDRWYFLISCQTETLSWTNIPHVIFSTGYVKSVLDSLALVVCYDILLHFGGSANNLNENNAF